MWQWRAVLEQTGAAARTDRKADIRKPSSVEISADSLPARCDLY